MQTKPDIDRVLSEKRLGRVSLKLPVTLNEIVREGVRRNGISLNEHAAIVLARDAALQGWVGHTSSDWDDLENSIRRSLVIARGIRAGSNGNRRIA